MKNSIDYYLVEGECEDRFIKSSDLIGRVECIDLSEKSVEQINKWSTKLPANKKKLYLNIVFDTDVLLNNKVALLRFFDNIRFLKKKGFNIRLLQQNKDFEEELCHCLGVSKQRLFEKFNARNNREFKQNFISEKKTFIKLEELNSSFRMWMSSHIMEFLEFKEIMFTYEDLPKKPLIKT